ncbi:ABC transporter ATP-binding protein [Actinospica durhamensis]|uniref:ABC transporter ATP-binding protein n=1 Tax=Actinospica durhamensis TaxID=1508375 RepID=A0A941EQQ2_9ACTN|nr:ABC transporter ATP-binding protein [Actinospica durhamensis]MBR7835621.1 ABC transporter ATP-binding protein [Actinospica durhamensis]
MNAPRLLPVAPSRDVLRWAVAQARRRPGLLAATLAAMGSAAAASLAAPLATGEIVQALAAHRGGSAVVWPAVRLGVAVVVGAGAVRAAGRLLARLVLPAVADLREQVLEAAVALPVDVVEAGGAGDLIARVCDDVEQLTDAAQNALGNFAQAALTIAAAFVGLAALDWRFLLAACLAVPVQLWTLRWYLRACRPVYAAGRTADGRRTAALLGVFAAMPTIRALRLESRRLEVAQEASLDAAGYEFQATRLATRFYGRLNAAEFLGLGAILATAAVLIADGQTSLGDATSAALFFVGLFDPINVALGVFDDLQQASAGLGRLLGVVISTAADSPSASPSASPSPPRRAHDADRSLRVEDVCFSYDPGTLPDAVVGVSLEVGPGRTVAVVGVSGSGKTTLAGIIAGFYRPSSGRVHAPAGRVALVAQQPHVFAGTLADNLRLAAPDASDEALRAALDRTGASAWVDALPQGSATPVGAGGHPLTVGQAQHLALTRVLLLDPAYLVLDEATAEGGSDAARVLDRAATTVTRGRAALVIAHRLSQAAEADHIHVMRAGQVVESGTHRELVAEDGEYARLWHVWNAFP